MGETYNADMLVFLVLSQLAAGLVNFLADFLPGPRAGITNRQLGGSGARVKGYRNRLRAIAIHGILFGGFWFFGSGDFGAWEGEALASIFAYFVLVAVIDIEHRLILNPVIYGGAALMGMFGAGEHSWFETLLGGAAGLAIFYLLFWLAQWLAKQVSARRGEELSEVPFGGGDVKLAGVIGLLLGWPGVIAGLFLGLILAGFYSAGLIVWRWMRGRYKAFDTIPLAPFLGAGAMLAIILSAAV